MKTKTNLILGTALFATFLSILILYPYRRVIKNKIKAYIGYSRGEGKGTGQCYDCPALFTDNVARHELAYKNKQGITPQRDEDGLDDLLENQVLVKLKCSKYYKIQSLRFSKPYILPVGEQFLFTLGKTYAAKCAREKLAYVPFTISSVTRSKESVQALMEGNRNAIKNSAHLKGKTFDINYRAFGNNKTQTKHFIAALKELRLQKKCFVKFEKNGCLHITVI